MRGQKRLSFFLTEFEKQLAVCLSNRLKHHFIDGLPKLHDQGRSDLVDVRPATALLANTIPRKRKSILFLAAKNELELSASNSKSAKCDAHEEFSHDEVEQRGETRRLSPVEANDDF